MPWKTSTGVGDVIVVGDVWGFCGDHEPGA